MADGNFLWTSLMADAVRDKLDGGFNLAHVETLLRETTGGLEGYLLKWVYERINENFKSETAMALIIASHGVENWVAFWLLLASRNGETPPLEDPNYALTMPYHSCDRHAIERMMKDTIKFLRISCRDILTPFRDPGEWMPWHVFDHTVTFAHRTVHDFVLTEAIQELLYRYSPSSFSHSHFTVNLGIATARVGITGTADPSEDLLARHRSLDHAFGAMLDAIKRQQRSKTGSTMPLELAEEIEKVTMHHLLDKGATNKTAGEVLLTPTDITEIDEKSQMGMTYHIRNQLRLLCCFLAGYGLFNLMDTILREWPKVVMYESELPKKYTLLSFSLGMDYKADWAVGRLRIQAPFKGTNVDFLRRLLEAGADPNAKISKEERARAGHQWSTPWCMFLGRLVESEKSLVTEDAGTNASEQAAMQEREFSPPSVVSSSTSDTKLALSMLLDHGAEIKLSEVGAVVDYRFGSLPFFDGRIEPLEALRKLLTSEELSKLGVDTL